MRKVSNLAVTIFAGSLAASLMMGMYSQGHDSGYMEGSAAGFSAGLKAKPQPPKVIIITPPKGEFREIKPKAVDSILYRI